MELIEGIASGICRLKLSAHEGNTRSTEKREEEAKLNFLNGICITIVGF